MNTSKLTGHLFFLIGAMSAIPSGGCHESSDDSASSTEKRSALSELASPGTPGTDASFTLGGKPQGIRYCRRADTTSGQTCSDAELQAALDLLETTCADALNGAYGADHVNGDFAGGACESYVKCFNACTCQDETCRSACGQPSDTCIHALKATVECATSAAQRGVAFPACDGK